MANLIQIKRSLNNASPTSLANGEFAYTANGDVLFIGSNGAVVAIGGKRNPGVLTANQALVANATGYLDTVKVANAIITSLSANGSYGSNGQVLVTNGTALYWGTGTSGSNTQVQFNDSGVANGSAGFTFDKTTNTLAVGNTLTVNNVFSTTQVNSALISVGSSFIANTTGAYHTGTVNAASLTVGTSTIANSTGVYTGTVNAASHTVGASFTANSTLVNAAAINIVNQVNTATLYASSSANVGSLVQVNTTAYYVASNSTVNTVITATSITQANTTDTPFVANSSGVFSTGTVNAAAVTVGTTFIANTTKTTVNTDLTVTGNTKLGDSSSDVVSFTAFVNTDIMPSTNTTYSLGNNTLRWNEGHFLNVHSVSGYFDGSVTISGNLVVSGNVTTTNVASVIISDPMIYLAGNNYSSDLVDIGFTGNYNTGTVNAHTGLIRHAADDTFYLFKGLTQELDNALTVNVADPTFAIASLKTYLLSGALVSNTSTVTITANSTVNVNITANSMTLSTPLAPTSGGLGLSSFTSGDIIVANTGNSLSKLSLGSDGYVLQSNGTALIYNTLDGGTF